MNTEFFLLSAWQFPLSLFIVIISLLAIYTWYHRGIRFNSSLFYLGIALAGVVLAIASPIGVLADGYAFTAHMLQHMILLLLIPQFFLISLFSKPRPSSASPSKDAKPGLFTKIFKLLTYPSIAWGLGVGVMWVWHIPALCNAATGIPMVWGIQTFTLLAAGAAFWFPIYGAPKAQRLAPLSGILYLFGACVGCSLLGIYIAFTPNTVCPIFMSGLDPAGIRLMLGSSWGLSYAVDQQLGGLIMWIPSCILYVGSVMALMGRWYAGEVPEHDKLNPTRAS